MDRGRQLYRPLLLPGLEIPGNLLLAPLAGYSDVAFRSVCIEAGAALAFTEMVSCEALSRDRARTLNMARRALNERFLAIQLFTSRPESAARAVERLLPLGPDLFDLNCGCSVPKVLRSGSGAALLRDPELLERVVRALSDASAVPVSVKLRSGWDAASPNYLATAAAAISGGASMVTLHPRSRAQGFTGRADWNQIAELKRAVAVPVIGSGDLFTAEDARAMMATTGCDGIMFARGAIGNPGIFAAARAALEGWDPPPPLDVPTRLAAALHHLDLAAAARGEALACKEMRKHMQQYLRGIPGVARLRPEIGTAATRAEYARLVDRIISRALEAAREEVRE